MDRRGLSASGDIAAVEVPDRGLRLGIFLLPTLEARCVSLVHSDDAAPGFLFGPDVRDVYTDRRFQNAFETCVTIATVNASYDFQYKFPMKAELAQVELPPTTIQTPIQFKITSAPLVEVETGCILSSR